MYKIMKFPAHVLKIIITAILIAGIFISGSIITNVFGEQEPWDEIIGGIFDMRNRCVADGNLEKLKSIFLTSEKNGLWAYENEKNRVSGIRAWFDKQGATMLCQNTDFVIKRVKKVGRGYSFYIVASNEYNYSYNDDPDTVNIFRIGTYHSLDLIPGPEENSWIISREWYDDPFSKPITAEFSVEISEYISSMTPADLSGLNERRINAVEYADRYCGAASTEEYGFSYNKNYTDYNPLGGDCANFASQVLYEGGGFKKTTKWNYRNGKGNFNWLKSVGLKGFLLYSGRASLLGSGNYSVVYKLAYKLLPGDIIAYAEKGKTTHVSVVTGLDSKGYPLVNCHNVDRFRVPWDIGWNDKNTKFYLLRVNY